MYKTILVPLDGSRRAEKILPHMEELARRYQAEIVFFRVVEPPILFGEGGASITKQYEQDLERRIQNSEQYLEAQVRKFTEKGLAARSRLGGRYPVVEGIVTAAEEEDADLIALASHGRSGISRFFYGSVAAAVLHRIDRPLFLIRSQDPFE